MAAIYRLLLDSERGRRALGKMIRASGNLPWKPADPITTLLNIKGRLSRLRKKD